MLKQNYTILIICILSLFIFDSCRNKENDQQSTIIERAIEIAEEEPNQALFILDSIQYVDDLSEKDYMLYQIASVKVQRKLNQIITPEQTFLIKKAAEYFEKQKDFKNAALANHYTARAYKNQDNIEKEFTYYMKAYSQAEVTKDSLLMGKAMYNLGTLYFDQNVYDSTFTCIQKTLPLFANYPEQKAQSYQLLASYFYLKKDYANALNSLDKGYPLLKDLNNNQHIYLYNILYGAIYKETKRYKESASYLRKNLDKNIIPAEQLRAALNLTDIFTSTHDKDSANYYSQIAMPLLSKLEVKNTDDNYLLLFGYRVLQNYYIEQDNKPKIREYINRFTQKKEEINKANMAKVLLAIDQQMRLKKIDETQKEYSSNLIFYLLFTGISFFAILFIMIYVRKHRCEVIKELNEFHTQKNLYEKMK